LEPPHLPPLGGLLVFLPLLLVTLWLRAGVAVQEQLVVAGVLADIEQAQQL
jgi:hypothetical protein